MREKANAASGVAHDRNAFVRRVVQMRSRCKAFRFYNRDYQRHVLAGRAQRGLLHHLSLALFDALLTFALKNHRDVIEITQVEIADEIMGRAERCVRRWLADLERAGWIVVERGRCYRDPVNGNIRREPNRYRLIGPPEVQKIDARKMAENRQRGTLGRSQDSLRYKGVKLARDFADRQRASRHGDVPETDQMRLERLGLADRRDELLARRDAILAKGRGPWASVGAVLNLGLLRPVRKPDP